MEEDWTNFDAPRLAALAFSELHLGKQDARYRTVRRGAQLFPMPAQLREEAGQLFTFLSKSFQEKGPYFGLQLGDKRMRVCAVPQQNGLCYVVKARTMAMMEWGKLGLPAAMDDLLVGRPLQGLTIVCGPEGTGKDLVSSSAFLERLRLHGGIGVSIGNHPPYPLNGTVGLSGISYQFLLDPERQKEAFRRALRLNADHILIYDPRDGESYKMALDLSAIGKNVILTLEASTVPEALKYLVERAILDSALHLYSNHAYRDFSTRLADNLVSILYLGPRKDNGKGNCRLHHVRFNDVTKSRIAAGEFDGIGFHSLSRRRSLEAA